MHSKRELLPLPINPLDVICRVEEMLELHHELCGIQPEVYLFLKKHLSQALTPYLEAFTSGYHAGAAFQAHATYLTTAEARDLGLYNPDCLEQVEPQARDVPLQKPRGPAVRNRLLNPE